MSIAMPPSRTKMTPSIRPAVGYVRLPARGGGTTSAAAVAIP